MKEKLMQQLKDLHFEAWSTSIDVLNRTPGAAGKYADICQQIDSLHFKLLEEAHIVNLTNQLS